VESGKKGYFEMVLTEWR